MTLAKPLKEMWNSTVFEKPKESVSKVCLALKILTDWKYSLQGYYIRPPVFPFLGELEFTHPGFLYFFWFRLVTCAGYRLWKTKRGCLKSMSGFENIYRLEVQPARLVYTSPRWSLGILWMGIFSGCKPSIIWWNKIYCPFRAIMYLFQ